MWKIFSGSKKTTREEVSIFVLEKKLFEQYSKEDRDEIFHKIRGGVTQLTKIRHPQVLTVQHPLEESRESFAFATEPIFASLANILGDATNMPKKMLSKFIDFNLCGTEIKFGLLQIFEGMHFIHNEAKLVHRNISPHSIVLNKHGIWKVYGFDYSMSSLNTQCYLNIHANKLISPSLEYTAPECVLDNILTIHADLYSLGMLICAIYAKTCYPFEAFTENFRTFDEYTSISRFSQHPCIQNIPQDIRCTVLSMLGYHPDRRTNLSLLMKMPFFDDVTVRNLIYLHSLCGRDNLEKVKFFKGLPQTIELLPLRVNLNTVLPCIVKEFVHPTMIPFVLPNIFLISENCSQVEFEKHVFVHLKHIMCLQEPKEIFLIIMQNIEILLKLTSTVDIKQYILPMIYKALESSFRQVQELCLVVIPSFGNIFDYPSIKSILFPRIKKLCTNTEVVSVRVNCLLCIGQLLPHLDKWIVLDEVLKFLPTITSREPAVIMAIAGIYKISSNHELLGIPKEVIANEVLPFLWPLSIVDGLTLEQYNSLVVLIKDLSKRVEMEHTRKFEQFGTDTNNQMNFTHSTPTNLEKYTLIESPRSEVSNSFGKKSEIRHQHNEKVAHPNSTSLATNIMFGPIQSPSSKSSIRGLEPYSETKLTFTPQNFTTLLQPNRDIRKDYVDVVKYDFILRFVDISLNFTITKERILITQARNSGRFHILIGHEIHQVTIFDDSLKLSFIATIDDTSDVVSEFAIEELYTHENISVLIVCLYMDDRFQIYQISNNGKGNNEPIKPVQKIRRPGQSTKTFLVHYMSNMYLVAGYLESDIGKVASNLSGT
ncbi:SCY1-like protein 2 isoform X3 [Malaya genurostris]|uniref:SCY1-like protein 2 isoform X3 n=1 Tax=Malaya genurostris TaxID=325434 RepID=UPI0026F3D47E|nr:SCY1-like protein 2 isoform X3 [Malaya genurostris]